MVFLLFGNSTVSFASYALNTKKETKNIKGIIRADNSKILAGCLYSAIQGVAQTHVCFPDILLPQSSWLLEILKK
ncbi:hypothetical protein ACZ11_18075 [Lysinibacillus xylanilyticus]|uniref:Uncharacterized protein n=1 Tax=Lysinibacillus xylanilyticus TaxID=582475 RepID=A0A0K9F4L2_9BACI|nr:hypothetical protein ACZ11_18075 [Lysinibacillus xylanilyticus]